MYIYIRTRHWYRLARLPNLSPLVRLVLDADARLSNVGVEMVVGTLFVVPLSLFLLVLDIAACAPSHTLLSISFTELFDMEVTDEFGNVVDDDAEEKGWDELILDRIRMSSLVTATLLLANLVCDFFDM